MNGSNNNSKIVLSLTDVSIGQYYQPKKMFRLIYNSHISSGNYYFSALK